MTREQYESLPLVELRALAKARGLKKTSALRKSDLVKVMLDADLMDQSSEASEAAESANPAGSERTAAEGDAEAAVSGKDDKISAPEAAPAADTVSSEKKARAAKGEPEETAKPAVSGRNSRTGKSARKAKNAEASKSEQESKTSDRTPANNKHLVRNDRRNYDRQRQYGDRNQNQNQNAYQGNGQNQNSYPGDQTDRYDNADQNVPSMDDFDDSNFASGILEVMPEGFGFIRSDNFLPGEDDVYVSPSQIRKFRLKTGDVLTGNTRMQSQTEKYSALLYLQSVNGEEPYRAARRYNFEDMTPIFPNERIHLERPGGSMAMRIVDLVSPIGKGQRGMIVSPPKAGKTTLLKDCAKSILVNHPEMHVIILLIDERPEEVTDIKETVQGPNVEVIYSTFDETPEHHKRVSEMVIERAKRLVESRRDVIIFIDSITRLTRAYNQVVPPSGRTLTGGLDPAALHMPKRFFGAARNMREGGSLTILATALIDTGSKMDDVVYEEFKGTGNMELILNRKLQERRIFPAIDIAKSGTRRDDLLLTREEQDAMDHIRRALSGLKADEATESILNIFVRTKSNAETVRMLRTTRII